eukprot:459289_1
MMINVQQSIIIQASIITQRFLTLPFIMGLVTFENENDKWGLAIFFNVFGNFISAYGWVLQKKTHNEQMAITDASSNQTDSKQSLSYLEQWKWWLGYATYGIGSGISAISYGMGPQSLLLPLESTVIVFNAIFGAKLLNEHLYKKDYIGIALILFGLVIVVVVGPKGTDSFYTANDLELLFQQLDFLVFMSIYSVLSFIIWIFITLKYMEHATFYMLSLIFLAAYFGSWNSLSVTCLAAILFSSFADLDVAKQNFTHWLTYVIIIIWAISVVSLEYWRQKALSDYVSTYVLAIYRVFSIASGVVCAAMFFNDFENSTDKEIIIFVFAICIAMSGVFIIAMKVDGNDKLEDRKTVIVKTNNEKQYINQLDGDNDTDHEQQTHDSEFLL